MVSSPADYSRATNGGTVLLRSGVHGIALCVTVRHSARRQDPKWKWHDLAEHGIRWSRGTRGSLEEFPGWRQLQGRPREGSGKATGTSTQEMSSSRCTRNRVVQPTPTTPPATTVRTLGTSPRRSIFFLIMGRSYLGATATAFLSPTPHAAHNYLLLLLSSSSQQRHPHSRLPRAHSANQHHGHRARDPRPLGL